ncbi:MAG TPA: SpoIIE family protein phosphatase [Candidatus Acidoferrales bacterium]|nr:SpoIIE family protein phosphatase [Candidatus Acidoferrales bacterium]
MERLRAAGPIVAFAILLVVAMCVLAIASASVSNVISRSFATEAQVRNARLLAEQALELQLDEETGIRGWAATGSTVFLQPYRAALPILPGTLDRLGAMLTEMNVGRVAALNDARDVNGQWLNLVATPVLGGPLGAKAIQRYGKELIDRYRLDIRSIEDGLTRVENRTDVTTRRAIEQNTLVTVGALIALAITGFIVGIVQTRSTQQISQREAEAVQLRAAYAAERRVSDALQEAFLQKPLPTLVGVAFSATYIPAREERKVGGDWYEGVELGENRVMFAIGDVAGHGLEAAVSMNRARQAIVSAALLHAEPAKMLARVNDELIAERGRMVTAVCGIADAGKFSFTYATAGHPPPILVEPGRPPRVLPMGGVPLGVLASREYRTHTIQTVPGATLVLYTDGAVEFARDPIEGEKMLLEAIRLAVENGNPEPASAIRDHIFGFREAEDDVAILTLAFVQPEEGAGNGPREAQIVASASRGGSATPGTSSSVIAGVSAA